MLFTIGHSTRTLDEFLSLLAAHRIARVIDVRTVPRSARNPQFNIDSLPDALGRAGIAYTHLAALGGLRHPRKDSPNTGWRNESFRGYADYMQTPAFEHALAELIALAARERVAIMCAEAVPWRCHRSLIADALVAQGVAVEHIVGSGKPRSHTVTAFAKIQGTHVSYPPEQPSLELHT